jgi:hypothetical protein
MVIWLHLPRLALLDLDGGPLKNELGAVSVVDLDHNARRESPQASGQSNPHQ